jgi:hypothetical protein
MEPFNVTGLTEECSFVVAPRFNGSLGMECNRAATRTFEMCFFGPFF